MQVRHATGHVSFDVADGSVIAKSILIREAAEQLAAWPQYRGYHDGDEWYVVRATQRIALRGNRIAAMPGDLMLCRDRDPREAETGLRYPTCYSSRLAIHFSTDPRTIERCAE